MALRRPADVVMLILCGHVLFFSCGAYANDSSGDYTRNPIPNLKSEPCLQDFQEKSAYCGGRGFDHVPNDLNRGIFFLDMSRNFMTRLLNSSFLRYTLLVELDISLNDIRFIESAAFYPLEHLSVLEFNLNENLDYLPSDLFRRSHELTHLRVSGCSLLSFPNGILKWLPKLIFLEFAYNRISFVNVTSDCSGNDKNLHVALQGNQLDNLTFETFRFNCKCGLLDLTDNLIKYVDPDVLASLQVEELQMGTYSYSGYDYSMDVYYSMFTGISRSSIESFFAIFGEDIFYTEFYVPLNFFEPLRNKDLSELTVMGPVKLIPSMFANITRVKRLVVTASNQADFTPPYFNGISGLTALSVSYNKIFYIDTKKHFEWDLNITELILSRNVLKQVPCSAFNGMNNLLKLDLSDNPHLYFLCASTIAGLSKLEYLDVSRTALRREDHFYLPHLSSFSFSWRLKKEPSFFWYDLFANTSSLEIIVAKYSYLTLSELWDQSQNLSIFHELNYLRFLDLSNNDIQSLPLGLFPKLIMLRELNLRHCEIRTIESGVFTGLEALETLHLDNNRFVSVPLAMSYRTLKHLKILYLHFNYMKHLEEDTFVHMSYLTNLTLSYNELTSLNRSTFTPIYSTLKSIDIAENPFECSCGLKWLVVWCKTSIDVLHADQTVCSPTSKSAFAGKSITVIDADTLCTSNVALFCTILFLVIGLFLGTSFAYHKRWVLRYQILLLRLKLAGYEEVQDPRDHGDFEFDVNVMFCDDDKEWIDQYLRPSVENGLPHFRRIAFGDDHLPLGMYYVDAVLYVIEHSFKTVLLLSRAAIGDQQFMMKLRTALNHNVQSNVLIFLEDISEEDMPHLVKQYLSEERLSFMFWVEDEIGRKYFWKELIKLLTVSQVEEIPEH